MREIKWNTKLFKVWNGQKFWDNKVSIVNGIDEMFGGEVDVLVFLENTFLIDKNGVEIYEGDILETHKVLFGKRFESIKYQVCFYNAGYHIKSNNYMQPLKDKDVSDMELELIGNIYENKELLNG